MGGTCPKHWPAPLTISLSPAVLRQRLTAWPSRVPMTEDRNLVPANTADVGRTHRITGMRNRPPHKLDNPAADRWRAHWWGCLAEPEAIGGPAASRLRTDGEDE